MSSPDSSNLDSADTGASSAPASFARQHTTLLVLVVVGLSTTGYFIGLKSPMTAYNDGPKPTTSALLGPAQHDDLSDDTIAVVPATHYAGMPDILAAQRGQQAAVLKTLRQEAMRSGEAIQVSEAEKHVSLADRATRRAFNGAPPTVPHQIDQLNDTACMACHDEGLKSATLRAGKMPHPVLTNCTQCHVEQNAKFTVASMTFESTFAGVSAPQQGHRAYPGAPPVIPHTTLMRGKCLSCHGRTAAPGMATTHPWRTNCLQCHGESSILNQAHLDTASRFLPPPAIAEGNE